MHGKIARDERTRRVALCDAYTLGRIDPFSFLVPCPFLFCSSGTRVATVLFSLPIEVKARNVKFFVLRLRELPVAWAEGWFILC